MRTVVLGDPALEAGNAGWMSARDVDEGDEGEVRQERVVFRDEPPAEFWGRASEERYDQVSSPNPPELEPTPEPQPEPEPEPEPTPKRESAPERESPLIRTTARGAYEPAEPAPKPVPAPQPDPPTKVMPSVPTTPDLPSRPLDPPIAPPTPAEEIDVPEFVVPGFGLTPPTPAADRPLRTVLSGVLGPDLWQRCLGEWTPAHCLSLARIARAVDGLAPSASDSLRSSAGAGMRWLGMTRERDEFAVAVSEAISHPAGASDANRARTVRLYGAAICTALGYSLRRCACHRDLERDVSEALIRLGLEELANEIP